MANPFPFASQEQQQHLSPPSFHHFHPPFLDDDYDYEKERKKKRQKMIQNIVLLSSGATFAVAITATLLLKKQNRIVIKKVDHRTLPRPNRRVFDHARAFACIQQDYTGPDATFNGANFKETFRISRPRFEALVQSLCNTSTFWHNSRRNCFGTEGASTLAKVLLPLKCLAFGVPVNAFLDYFQLSKTLAKKCYENFVLHIPLIWSAQYLALPTKKQIKEIVTLHESVHGVPGMLGSLDCMHTYWDKCPKAYHGVFKGKEKRPSIVLEGACDYNMYFWHSAYGFPGTMNDINIINASSLLKAFIDGTMVEDESESIPFSIMGEQFKHLFLLTDGIYPTWVRFVKAISEAGADPSSTSYKIWQEKSRKDIERAFGVLQIKFPIVARPFKFHKTEIIANTVTTCLILHNMCVQERVNETNEGDYSPRPVDGLDCVQTETLHESVPDNVDSNAQSMIGQQSIPVAQLEMALRMADHYCSLTNADNHMKLRRALEKFVHENHLHLLLTSDD